MMPRLHVTGAGSFADVARLLARGLKWWRDELLRLLPPRLRHQLYRPLPRLLLVPDRQGEQFLCRGPAARVVDAAGHAIGSDAYVRRVRLAVATARVEAVLALPPEQVLRTRVTYPARAAADLRQILRHDIDRHTPFAPGDVWFDHLHREGAAGSNATEVELLAVPRSSAEPMLERVESQVGGLDGMDVLAGGESADDATLGVNLLPEERRRRRYSATTAVVSALALIVLGLGWVAARQAIDARAELLDTLREQVSTRREEAQATAALRTRLEESISDLEALVTERRRRPRALEVLVALTRALPDHTWVDQLSLDGTRVDVVGQSESSTAVVRRLEQSPMFSDVQFRSQVVVDRRSGKERFRVQARLVAAAGGES